MFFAPALRNQAVGPASSGMADFGFQRFLSDTLGRLMPQFSGIGEDDTSWTLTLDVPGVPREQLEVNVRGHAVEIQTTKEAARQIRASFELPGEIDIERSEAKLEHGVLTLRLAKAQSAVARRIDVN